MPELKAATFLAATLTLFLAGCSTPSSSSSSSMTPPPPALPPPAAQANVAPPPLNADQMAKLCQESPDACRRVQTAQPLTLSDVKVMAKLGFTSDVIVAVVKNSHTVYHLTANDIIDLTHSGVSNQVIDFLISTPTFVIGSLPVPEPQINAAASQTPPPEPFAETTSQSPGPDYAWVDGDWVWNGGWVWVGGHWVLPPYPAAVWVHGRWSRGWRGYRREPGHWR
jgi:hypothetical protein